MAASNKSNTERANPLAAAGLQPKLIAQTETGEQDRTPTPAPQSSLSQAVPISASNIERKSEEERATEKVTAYFTPPQYDKIEELRRQHRLKTHKRISVNALLRRLVEHASIEDIL